LVVIFMCNHCPFVKHLADGLAAFAREYQPRGAAIVGINANDPGGYPDDSPERMIQEAEQRGYTFPYLFDETQEVAQAYRAACTPDFFVFDKEQKLVYRGQFDPSRPNSGKPVTGEDLRRAVDAVLAGQKPDAKQTPSIGCNIKWRAGAEPDYFSPKGIA
jgi:thiol-disulfide isomerase/thioredoxin